MGTSKFTLNRAGMGELLKSPGIRADMLRRAEAVAAAARSSAPVDTGEHRDSIRAELGVTDRAVGRVVAANDHAVFVEAKTRNLGAALDAAG